MRDTPAGRPSGAVPLRWLLLGFLVAVAVFLGVAVIDRWSELVSLWDRVAAYPWRLSSTLLVASAAAWSAALVLTGAAWARFFRRAGGRLGPATGTLAWLATNLGRYIPGKVWQVTGLAVYVRRKGDSGALAVSTSVAVQGVTLLAGLGLAAALLGGDLAVGGGLAPRAVLLVALLGLFLHPAVIRGFTRLLARWLGETVDPGPMPRRAMLWLAGGLTVAWVLQGLAFWLFLLGVVGPDAPPPGTSVGIFAVSYLAGYAVFLAPAGLMVREGAMAVLLAALTPLPTAVAAAAAIGARLWVTVAELAALAAGWMWARSRRSTPGKGSRARGERAGS